MRAEIGSVLGTPEQIRRDRKAVRIYDSELVQRAIRELEEIYSAAPIADLPSARTSLKAAAAATGMAQALSVVNRDPDRPSAHWAVTSPHSWGDLHVPLSGLMIDDPDNVYRTISIDGEASYAIRGHVIGDGPTQETYVLHEHHSGATTGEKVRTNEVETGSVSLHDLPLDQGRFTITIDSSPPDGRISHIQSNPAIRDGYVIICSTLADWWRNDPSRIEVERVCGPAIRPEASDGALIAQAAERTITTGRYWLAWTRQLFFDRPVNSITHSFARVSGWGHVSCGHYNIAADEALVFHLERRGAAYLGFQVCDVWGQGQDAAHIEQNGSLNGSQSQPNADGSYTYVLAKTDPGIHNWLNTVGSASGTFGIRWQQLPAGVSASDAVRSISVVKMKDLASVLPPDTAWIAEEARATQLRERLESYQRRLRLP